MADDPPVAFDPDDERFTAWLRRRAEPDWSAAVDHRFVTELSDGTLDEAAFRRYLLQDYAFVETLVSVVGHAVAQAPTMESKARLAAFLGTLTDEENDYFERSFDALGVPPGEYEDPSPTGTTRAFADHLLAAARGGDYAGTLAVLLPAEWIYREWATAVDGRPERFYLAEWVDLHATPEFDSFVDWLRTELDREGAALPPRRRERVADRFERTAALEVAFFESTYGAD